MKFIIRTSEGKTLKTGCFANNPFPSGRNRTWCAARIRKGNGEKPLQKRKAILQRLHMEGNAVHSRAVSSPSRECTIMTTVRFMQNGGWPGSARATGPQLCRRGSTPS